MLTIDDEALREGLERAADVFKLHRLSTPEDADHLAASTYANLGLDEDLRIELVEALIELLPITDDPLAAGMMASSMSSGVLVGLLIANAAAGSDPDALPDYVPADF